MLKCVENCGPRHPHKWVPWARCQKIFKFTLQRVILRCYYIRFLILYCLLAEKKIETGKWPKAADSSLRAFIVYRILISIIQTIPQLIINFFCLFFYIVYPTIQKSLQNKIIGASEHGKNSIQIITSCYKTNRLFAESRIKKKCKNIFSYITLRPIARCVSRSRFLISEHAITVITRSSDASSSSTSFI